MNRVFAGAIALMIGLGALAGVSEAEARDQTREKRVEQNHAKKNASKRQQAQKRHWKKGSKYTGKVRGGEPWQSQAQGARQGLSVDARRR